MSPVITITLLGEPVAWRHRTSANGKHRYLPEKQRNISAALRLKAEETVAQSRALYDGLTPDPWWGVPVRLYLTAEFTIPASWSPKKRNAAILREILPAKKPDLDNLMKLAGDCLSGVVFRDDSFICEAICRKQYSTHPKITITIEPIQCKSQ